MRRARGYAISSQAIGLDSLSGGGVSERPKERASKAREGYPPSEGSNPSATANRPRAVVTPRTLMPCDASGSSSFPHTSCVAAPTRPRAQLLRRRLDWWRALAVRRVVVGFEGKQIEALVGGCGWSDRRPDARGSWVHEAVDTSRVKTRGVAHDTRRLHIGVLHPSRSGYPTPTTMGHPAQAELTPTGGANPFQRQPLARLPSCGLPTNHGIRPPPDHSDHRQAQRRRRSRAFGRMGAATQELRWACSCRSG
jgi:hypothetical protein